MLRLIEATLITIVFLALYACSPSSDQDDGQQDLFEACVETCEDTYAEDLLPENCNEWCTLDSALSTDGVCTCTFNSCDSELCTQWCVENEDLPIGVCYFDDCNCTN